MNRKHLTALSLGFAALLYGGKSEPRKEYEPVAADLGLWLTVAEMWFQPPGKRFHKANFHLGEAGHCMALDRSTAAVSHLMRCLEVGLDGLAFALNLPCSKKNWKTVIDDIEKAIVALPTSGPGWKADKEFYGGVALELRFIKDAWRNHVAHGRAKYTEDEASKIFRHVKAFMAHLAPRL